MIIGSGNRITVTRPSSGIAVIRLEVPAILTTSIGNNEAVTIDFDDNLVSLIRVDEENGKLVVSATDQFKSEGGLHLGVVASALNSLEVLAPAKIAVTGLKGPSFSATTDGAVSLECSGSVTSISVTTTGSGAAADLFAVNAEDAEISITGVGNIKVMATRSLDVTINGVGDVAYKGNPPTINKHVTGVGSVHAG
ncbi:MAG TPA: DUF2807 domain-containing protein [Bryobacteraceae bacterium]